MPGSFSFGLDQLGGDCGYHQSEYGDPDQTTNSA
jgi:hypothetical protein